MAAGMKGKLTITVVEAKELPDKELLGKMDPYVTLECGKEKHKTKVQKAAGTAPKFNQTFIFNLEGKEDTLHVHLYDEDLLRDDKIGRVDIPLQKLAATSGAFWYQLVDHDNFKKTAGSILLKVESFQGTGLTATTAAAANAPAPAKQQQQQQVVVAAAPAQAQVQVQAQPQVVYAQAPVAGAPAAAVVYAQQPQVVYAQAPAAAAQPTLVRGTDGKLYAIQQPVVQQPQVVYVQAPAGAVVQQPPRYM